MQEDLEQRTVTLVINSSKFTVRTLMKSMKGFLGFVKHQAQKHQNVKPQGKQSVKKLIGQNQGVSNAELEDDRDIRPSSASPRNTVLTIEPFPPQRTEKSEEKRNESQLFCEDRA